MYERFTERLKKIFQTLARQKAVELGHSAIEPEHILYAMIKEGSNVATNVFKNLDVDLSKLLKAIDAAWPTVEVSSGTSAKVELSPRSLELIQAAAAVSRAFNVNYIGTDEVGVAVFEFPGCKRILESFGMTREVVETETKNLLGIGLEGEDTSQPLEPQNRLQISFALPEFIDTELVEDALVGLFTALNEMHVASGGSGLKIDEGQAFLGSPVREEVPS